MIVLIPARIGSKGVPLKNLRDLGGYPLVLWSVASGYLLGYETIVSTDSQHIIEIVKRFGCRTHYRRTGGDDLSTDIEVVVDFLTKWRDNEIIYLRPTTPFRNPVLLKEAIDMWSKNHYDSLCSGHILLESADKLMKKGEDMEFIPYNDAIKLEDIHNPRQTSEETIQTNGVIDIFKTDKVKDGILWGENMLGFITPKTIEIDTPKDLDYANWWLSRNGHPVWDYLKAVYAK